MREIERDWLPHLEWMKSLETLALIKLGPCGVVNPTVCSPLLDVLCRFLFPLLEKKVKPALRPHRCIWIQGFELEIWPFNALDYADPEFLQCYRTEDHGDEIKNDFKSFSNLVQLDTTDNLIYHGSLLADLKKLKYFRINSSDDEEVIIILLSF